MASSSAILKTMTVKYNAAKTSVWWDLEQCGVPKGFDFEAIIQNIKTAMTNMNYIGPVSFSIYVDNTTQVPSSVRKAFESSGISLSRVTAGLDRDKKMLVDMILWAVDNPAPANFLLISGDRKTFSHVLDQLDRRGFNTMLAYPGDASGHALFPGAKSVWHWTSLLSGGFPIAFVGSHPELLQGQSRDASRIQAPSEFFEVSRPEIPRIPIPILFTRAPESDMLDWKNIERFNGRLKRQRRIKNDEPEKLFNYKNRYEEEGQPLSEYKSTGVCIALQFVREQMMIPTKQNIADVIRYGDRGDPSFDVEEALDIELEHDMIVTQKLGDLSLYLPRNGELWQCVNPEGGSEEQYAKATWDSIQNFLSSLDGRIEMILSESRYDACLKLKNSCLRNIPLGRVQQIMNLIIAKGWIKPSPGGWKQVSITLARRD